MGRGRMEGIGEGEEARGGGNLGGAGDVGGVAVEHGGVGGWVGGGGVGGGHDDVD